MSTEKIKAINTVVWCTSHIMDGLGARVNNNINYHCITVASTCLQLCKDAAHNIRRRSAPNERYHAKTSQIQSTRIAHTTFPNNTRFYFDDGTNKLSSYIQFVQVPKYFDS